MKKIILLGILIAFQSYAQVVGKYLFEVPPQCVVYGGDPLPSCPTGFVIKFGTGGAGCTTTPTIRARICCDPCLNGSLITQDGEFGLCAEGVQEKKVTLTGSATTCSSCATSVSLKPAINDSINACYSRGGEPSYNATNDAWGCAKITGQCSGASTTCLDRRPVPDALCAGGLGYQYAGAGASVANKVAGDGYNSSVATVYYSPIKDAKSFIRFDGSECSLFNTGTGPLISMIVCPAGWSENACKIRPSLSHCNKSSSSTASSSSSGGISSAVGSSSASGPSTSESDVCEKYPNLCLTSSSSTGGGGVGDSGVTCADLGGCDWSTAQAQLIEIGLAENTVQKLESIYSQLEAGYVMDAQRNALLTTIANLLADGNDSTGNDTMSVKGIDSLLSILDSAGSGAFGNQQYGNGISGADSIDDLTELATPDQFRAKVRADSDSLWGEIDLLTFGNRTSDSISSVFDPLIDYISVPPSNLKIDMSFDAGMVSCKACIIDLRDIYGFDIVPVINGLLLILTSIATILMIMRTMRTGGHS